MANAAPISVLNFSGEVNNGVGGIGYLEVAPAADTTYTLTLNGTITAQTTIRLNDTLPGPERKTFDRAGWELP